MTGTDLIVFLPLIAAIGGAIVGGFVGAWANNLYRDREAKKAWDRERDGLRLLVDDEISHNRGILARFTWEPADLLNAEEVYGLSMDAWQDARVRLAQLADEEHFALFADYYRGLQDLSNLVLNRERRHNPKTDAQQIVQWALEAGEKAQAYRYGNQRTYPWYRRLSGR